MLRYGFGGGVIPMIAVGVRHQHGVDSAQYLGGADGQRHQRVALLIARIRHRRIGAWRAEDGVNQKRRSRERDPQACMANQLNVHSCVFRVGYSPR